MPPRPRRLLQASRREAPGWRHPNLASDEEATGRTKVHQSTERRGTLTYHPANPAMRLIDVAMITAPSGNDSHACRSAVRRICLVWMLVSETWNVMPIVKDR